MAKVGFNTTLLGGEKYAISQLKRLTNQELSGARYAFIKNAHLRFLKEFFYHQPYGKREPYNQKVQTASLEKLAKLIHVTALLLQTKVYLFLRAGNPLFRKLTISRFTTTITIDVPSATQGKECTLKATLKDENGSPMQNIDVDFYIYEANTWKKIGTAKTDSNGVASLNYTPSSTGTFQVKAMFSGTTNYAQSSSTSANLNVAMDYTPYYIGGGIVAVAVISVAGYMLFRRRKKVTISAQQSK